MKGVKKMEDVFISDEQIEKMEKAKVLLSEILDMKNKIMTCLGNESAEKAIQGAIDWKTKSGYRFLTYIKNGEKLLALIDTENNSSIVFKVEKIVGGTNPENFHPERMFVGRPVKGC